MSYPNDPYRAYPPAPNSDDKTWAILAHLSAPIAGIVSAGWVTFGGPLVIWFLKKDSPFVRSAAAGAFNFAVSMWLLSILGWIMVFTVILAPIGFIVMAIAGLMSLILGVIGAMRVSSGQFYKYPMQIRILS